MPCRILVVEDDPFTRRLVTSLMTSQGHLVRSCAGASEAIELIEDEEPNCIVCDLDLGSAVNGIDLLRHVHSQQPRIGLIALTAHRDPALVGAGVLPQCARYLVKSDLEDLTQLNDVVTRVVLSAPDPPDPEPRMPSGPSHRPGDIVTLSSAQAVVLRLLAQGLSNEAIASQRGVSVRAVEYMLHRIYTALGLEQAPDRHPRVDAIRAWQQGTVSVR